MTTTVGPDDEAGMAMITAILVSVVVLFLGFVATGLSDHSFSSTRVDQKRVTTFHAAEGGIDHALQLLQTSALAALPCATPLARSLGGGAYAPDYLVTFTYYAAYPISGSAMACPLSAEPAAAVVRSTGGSSDPLGTDRAVEAVVRLSVPTGLGAFPRTVFSDLTVDYDGPVHLTGDATRDADLYTNGSINCDFGGQVIGNLVAQGSAALSNGCSVTRSVFANGAVTAANNVHVAGDVTSSTGSVTVSGSSTVSGNVQAGLAITVDGTSSAPNQNAFKVTAAPTAAAFPNPTYDAAAWTAAGYSLVSPPTCAAATTALAGASSWSNPTVVRVTGCRLDVAAGSTIELNRNVAIVSDGGFDLGAAATVKTTPSAPAGTRLLLFVPHGSSCSGTAGRIVMHASVTFAQPLQVFAYTPCLLQAQGTLQGQLYGGTVRFTGPFAIQHASVGALPGYVPTSLTVARAVAVASAPREVTP